MTDAPYRKKLVETALPLEAINAACKTDKDRKTSTTRSIHKWFARMPVPALRALIFASLVDDPMDDLRRQELFKLIEDLVASGVENPPDEIRDAARREIQNSIGPEALTVFDPFVGGGSTLVEAQRLGLRSIGSDLNPIPVLIGKALVSIPPQMWGRPPLHAGDTFEGIHGDGLTGFISDVRHYAKRIQEQALKQIGHLYPAGPNGDVVSAWWWARTVESPDPRYQGCHVPLVSNWWLSKRRGNRAFVEPVVDQQLRTITYSIASAGTPPEPSKGRCLYSGEPIPFKYIREKGNQGALGVDLIAVVTNGAGQRYHAPDASQLVAARDANPSEPLSLHLPDSALGFRVQNYGMHDWAQLFTLRQQVSLSTFADLVAAIPGWVAQDGGDEVLGQAIATFLGLCVGKLSQTSSALCRWMIDGRNGAGGVLAAFASQYLSMSWDFVETSPFGGSVGDWLQVVESALGAYKCVDPTGPPALVMQKDARTAGDEMSGQCLIVTDPPYFAAVGYANLSDYFYPWIRRALRSVYPEELATVATPKIGELIAEPARHKDAEEARDYFVLGFTETFRSLKHASRPELPVLIVYAYKEQESGSNQASSGWEAMLEAVLQAGLAIVGTWPIHGTGSARIRGYRSNALATYVVLVCRPRLSDSLRVSRRELLASLRTELGGAIQVLQSAAIAPVDLAQAVMGPGMAIFTRYQAVLEPDGTPMTVRSALLLINSVLAEVLDEQEGEFDADTRWAITWFEQFQFGEASSGDADSLARAKVTSIDGLERAGVIATRAGSCRLVRRDELPASYDPTEDRRATVWESVQHLVKQLLDGGEQKAASLFARLSNAEAARDLAYRLYAICERKGWAEEGGVYNVLVASWPEIARLAQQQQTQQRFGSGQLPGLG